MASTTFPTTQKEKERVALIKETGEILKKVYKNIWAVYEVNAAIKTGYYVDERVLLKDLLTPEKSRLYQTEKFMAAKVKKGVFKNAFAEELLKGDYPLLKLKMGVPSSALSRAADDIGWPSVDSVNEIWSDAYGVSIYFPYSENFPMINPLDVTLNTIDGQLVTIVSADREADAGPGSQAYYCVPFTSSPEPVSLDNLSVCYRQVLVNDDYAEIHPTHIVGVGAEPARIATDNPPPQINVVFIGEVKCTKQYDHLITFNGYLQGGGPDLRFCRGSGYLTQDGNGQINNPQNVVQANPTRKDVRKERWVSVYSIWDADWNPANLNQVFAIYDEDKQGTSTVNLSLQTTLRTDSIGIIGGTAVGTVGFSWSFKTEDDIIRQLAWSRQSFFQYNQGGLNNGCGTRNGFTVYDCNSYVAYTMPTQ